MQQGCILYDKVVSAIKENVIPFAQRGAAIRAAWRQPYVLDYRKARKKKENK